MLEENYTGGRAFVCPVGMTCVIRHMDFTYGGLAIANYTVKIGATAILTFTLSSVTDTFYEFWDGYAAMYEGEQLDIFAGVPSDGIDMQVTGYAFSGSRVI
jgi:hypothetical protein